MSLTGYQWITPFRDAEPQMTAEHGAGETLRLLRRSPG